MIDDLRDFASSIILEVEPRLVTLFARSFPEIRVVPLDSDLSDEKSTRKPLDRKPRDVSAARLGRIPAARARLFRFDAARTGALRARLAPRGEKIVGLSWRSVSAKFGHNKSSKLIDFDQVLRLPGIRFRFAIWRHVEEGCRATCGGNRSRTIGRDRQHARYRRTCVVNKRL